MAAAQRDISVSEFFAKNRHLLGFDNPRKALLTTVKEAVDNSLDACEEAGILPEIWVHIEASGTNRFKIGVQDNGPGILKKQIPLIFGKLLYGSKFHRLRMSRGQQGIGISAAGMYGVLTTGKPVKIISKISPAHAGPLLRNPDRHESQTSPRFLTAAAKGSIFRRAKRGPNTSPSTASNGLPSNDQNHETTHGTRVTIELEGRFNRGRGSVDEYLEQTAIANPHVRLHYLDPEGQSRTVRALDRPSAARAERNQAASLRRRARPADDDAQGREGVDAVAISHDQFFARQPGRGAKDLRGGQSQLAGRAP